MCSALKILCLSMSLLLLACSGGSGLSEFSSDGCSLFPDTSQINQDDWCSCCFEHDLLYWRGGTADERELADLQLKQCVLEKTSNPTLADIMFKGVRFGGSPYFYNWYRWGYGWRYDRKYQTLTESESKLADHLQDEYFITNPVKICD